MHIIPFSSIRLPARKLILLYLVLASTSLSAADITWISGSGNWNTASNWSPPSVPSAADNVFIDNGFSATSSVVTLDINATISQLTLDAGDFLLQTNAHHLILSGDIINNGDWLMLGNNNTTTATFNGVLGTMVLGGSGRIVMANNTVNRITTDNSIITHNSGHTIQGAGNLLYDTGGMINQGSIIADQNSPLNINPNAKGFVNQGTLRATGSGGLHLYGGTYTNTGFDLDIQDGSQLNLYNDVTFGGGRIVTSGTTSIDLYDATLNAVNLDFTATTQTTIKGNANLNNLPNPLDGTVTQQNAKTATIQGDFTHSGDWALAGTSNATQLRFYASGGAIQLGGSGRIVMTDYSQNRIVTDDSVITHNTGHTIQGAGNILYNTGGMINQGSIIADQSTTLYIDPNAKGFVNQGTLRATGSGGLFLYTGSFTNTGFDLDIQDGSRLNLFDGVIFSGGRIVTSGTTSIDLYDATLNAVNLDFTATTQTTIKGNANLNNLPNPLDGTVTQQNAKTATIQGDFTHSGDWALAGTSNATQLRFYASGGAIQLGGSGRIVMTDYSQNRIVTDDSVITHNTGHTIQGAGNILYNTGGMINQGSIIADQSTTLYIDPNAKGFVNQGTLQATGTGGITLPTGPFTTSGNVSISSGSTLNRSGDYTQTGGSTAVNGVLDASGTVDLQGGSLTGNGEIRANVNNTLGTVLPGQSPGTLNISGDYTQNGNGKLSIEIAGLAQGSEYDLLAVSGNALLGGTLEVTLNGYTPTDGNEFTILTAASISGDFSALQFPTFNGSSFELIVDSNGGTVKLVAAPAIPDLQVEDGATVVANPGGIVDFGYISPLGGSIVKTLSLRNVGVGTLTLDPVPVSFSGTGAGNFTLGAQPSSPVLTQGISNFDISFDPGSYGVLQASVQVASDDPDGNPYSFVVLGTGADAECSGGDVLIQDNRNYLNEVIVCIADTIGTGSNVKVNDTADVTYVGSNGVTLDKGFSVVNGGVFSAGPVLGSP